METADSRQQTENSEQRIANSKLQTPNTKQEAAKQTANSRQQHRERKIKNITQDTRTSPGHPTPQHPKRMFCNAVVSVVKRVTRELALVSILCFTASLSATTFFASVTLFSC
jgi:Flp pilus assembly protein TadB